MLLVEMAVSIEAAKKPIDDTSSLVIVSPSSHDPKERILGFRILE
jgi:hypothetical protein